MLQLIHTPYMLLRVRYVTPMDQSAEYGMCKPEIFLCKTCCTPVFLGVAIKMGVAWCGTAVRPIVLGEMRTTNILPFKRPQHATCVVP